MDEKGKSHYGDMVPYGSVSFAGDSRTVMGYGKMCKYHRCCFSCSGAAAMALRVVCSRIGITDNTPDETDEERLQRAPAASIIIENGCEGLVASKENTAQYSWRAL